MNITRDNNDALNATVKITVAKADYEEKVEKTLKDYKKNRFNKRFSSGPCALPHDKETLRYCRGR